MFKPKLLNLLVYFSPMLVACLFSLPVPAQQPDEPGGETPETATSDVATVDDAVAEDADETAEDIEDLEDADLDEQTYEQDDDDFIPTEEIPADEPIPFPSNI